MRDPARAEEVVARGDVDPLVPDEERDLTVEDVERLVLIVMQVQGRPAAARVVDLDLRERVAGLGTACLDGEAAALPPDVGEALAGRDAIGLGDGDESRGAWQSFPWQREQLFAPMVQPN